MFLWIVLVLILVFGFVVFRGAPYVPSKRKEVEKAFDELCPLHEHDLVVDLGSGDGLVLRVVSDRGSRAVGYELNPILVGISNILSRNDPKVKTILADLWYVSFPPETTIVYVFGDSRDIAKMATKVQREATRLKRSLRLVSYGFAVPGVNAVQEVGAHRLYRIEPLQPK